MDAMSSKPPASAPVPTRRTRFVCISDTHNRTIKLPKGDVLIHAGDLTNQGSFDELSKAVKWLEKADYEVKLVVAGTATAREISGKRLTMKGNHDITLDKNFYAEYGQYFHNQSPQDPDTCIDLLRKSPTITYLCHERAAIQLTDPRGPQTTFSVFGSPYSPKDGMWAFGYPTTSEDTDLNDPVKFTTATSEAADTSGRHHSHSAAELWSQIPLNTDITITHTPPHLHCDESASRKRAAGCEVLRRHLWRTRPRLHVCGHVHDGRGAERVAWDIDGASGTAHVAYAESQVEHWQDPSPNPSSAKISIVDLTNRKGNRALENDGSHPLIPHEDASSCFDPEPGSSDAFGLTESPGVLGLGGDPFRTARCDREALLGRKGRKETCIVNCAITATSWPHTGGKQFNKPIIVDLDLPVWGKADE